MFYQFRKNSEAITVNIFVLAKITFKTQIRVRKCRWRPTSRWAWQWPLSILLLTSPTDILRYQGAAQRSLRPLVMTKHIRPSLAPLVPRTKSLTPPDHNPSLPSSSSWRFIDVWLWYIPSQWWLVLYQSYISAKPVSSPHHPLWRVPDSQWKSAPVKPTVRSWMCEVIVAGQGSHKVYCPVPVVAPCKEGVGGLATEKLAWLLSLPSLATHLQVFTVLLRL